MDTIPVALFAYARPEHLKKTLEGLKANKVPLIYAFCDGPEDESKLIAVKKVRDIVHSIDWAKTFIIEHDANMGLGNSVRSGISRVFEEFEKLIVIEDDIVMRPGAYSQTCKALKFYEKDPRVMTVSMWAHPSLIPGRSKNGYFSERFVCWGWGTYKWAWELYEGKPEDVFRKCQENGIITEKWGKDIKWQVDNAEKKNLWYIGYALTHFLYRKFSYFPGESWTINVGRDSTAENTIGGIQDNFSLIDNPVSPIKKFPIEINNQKKLRVKFRRYFNPRSKLKRILTKQLSKWT